MKIVIAGPRWVMDSFHVTKAIEASHGLFQITELVSGHCKGTDRIAELWAKTQGIPIKLFPYPGWASRKGGPMRNKDMAAYAEGAIIIVPKVPYERMWRGTKSILMECLGKHLPICVYPFDLTPAEQETCKGVRSTSYY